MFGCPPRHANPPPLPGDGDSIRIQIISVDTIENKVAWQVPARHATKPCEDVTSDKYYSDALSAAQMAELKRHERQNTVQIHGRTPEGLSVHLQVHVPITVAVEFPVTHDDFKKDVAGYFMRMERQLELEPGSLCNAQLSKRFAMRARSNNWVPDPDDPSKPRRFPVVNVSFRNRYEYDKAVEYMETTSVPGRGGIPYTVSVWETTDYVKPHQRFLLETDLTPGGWVNVVGSMPMPWRVSSCDVERWCNMSHLKPDHADQAICPLTVLSYDIEVKNGTEEDRRKMKKLGLDKFPKAIDPSNQVVQISVAVQAADGRLLQFLLELDDHGDHLGEDAMERRHLDGVEYITIYFQREQDMIVYLRDMIVFYDADVVLSFNGDFFDWPYIVARMGCLNPTDRHGRFYQMGRVLTDRWESQRVPYREVDGAEVPVVSGERFDGMKRQAFHVGELATHPGCQLTPELRGRVTLDLCALVRDMSKADSYLKFKNYTLDNMAERFLGDHKINFSHNDIFDAWLGQLTTERATEIVEDQNKVDALVAPYGGYLPGDKLPPQAQRRLLGDYCMKDTILPIKILNKLGIIMFVWQVSRVSSTPPQSIINGGQMVRVSTMFIKEAWHQGRVVNRVKNRAMAYQGATVLKPKRGYYGGTSVEDPPLDPQPPLPEGYDFEGIKPEMLIQRQVANVILTLDFKSLYPSIMLAHTLCPSLLEQLDEPLTNSERSAEAYLRATQKSRSKVPDTGSNTMVATISALEKRLENNPEDRMAAAALAEARDLLAQQQTPDQEEPESDEDEVEIRGENEGTNEELGSGVVEGLEDDDEYTTVRVVVTDKKGNKTGTRYHRYSKKDKGIYPVMLNALLGGRAKYKKLMKHEKGLKAVVKPRLNFSDTSAPSDTDAALAAVDLLRDQVKKQKDKDKLEEFADQWATDHANLIVHGKWILSNVEVNINIYDGRQKALKVMANSIYGVSGAKQHSPCACCKLAESVTAIGRQMIEKSKRCAEEVFKKYGCDVVYGDTDSIFVLIQEPDDVEAWRKINEIADYLTDVIFGASNGTVVMEAECLKRHFALFKKKNYVGMENEGVGKPYERGEKGIATVRRDKPEVLNMLIRDLNASFTELSHFPRETIARLLLRKCADHFEKLVQDRFPIDDYVIVQRINKLTKESAHLVMARKMQQRTDMPVQRGDAVSYVHIVDPAERLATRRVESPVMVKAHPDEIKIDRSYYLQNKLNIVRSTIELFMPGEVIDKLYSVYQFALDNPHTRTLTQAFGSRVCPVQERRNRVEAALDQAIAQGRMPVGAWFPPPLVTGRKKQAKPGAQEIQANERRLFAMLGHTKKLTKAAPTTPKKEKQQQKQPRRTLKSMW